MSGIFRQGFLSHIHLNISNTSNFIMDNTYLSSTLFKISVEVDICYDRYLLDAAWIWVKGMMMTIGCTGVVSVSASCGRHCNLAQSLPSPSCFLMYDASWLLHGHSLRLYIQHRYIPVSLCFTTSISSLILPQVFA